MKKVRKLLAMTLMLLVSMAAAVRGQSADGFDPNANGTVRVVVVQPDGKILIGGDFTALSPNGGAAVTRNRIARLNPDGTLDTAFNPNADDVVYSIVVQGNGKILVGGNFRSIGGQTRHYIARLDATTGLADLFDPNASGYVATIAVQADGKILVGGNFSFFIPNGGTVGFTRNHVARLDATTGVPDSFDPDPHDPINSEPFSIAVQADGKILVIGAFTSIGGQTRRHIARLDATTGLADSFDPNANGQVHSIVVQADGKILAGGLFSGPNSIGGQTRNGIARLDATTGLADSFDPNANSGVYAIAVQADGKIVAGGPTFTSIGGQPRNRIARLDATTGLADSFDPNANNSVFSIAVQADGKILAGGQFTSIGGQARNRIARLETGAPTPTPAGTPTPTPAGTPTPTPAGTPTPTPAGTPTPTPGGSGVFHDTGSLGFGRYQHTATLLPNGKVLVVGGYNGSQLASAELYDPASGLWTATGSLTTARQDHTATLLPNGKVLVAGGYDGSRYLASAELYDPSSGIWTATGSLATARSVHTAALLPKGKVLVAGGYNSSGALASAELYDAASGIWTATGSLATAREYHTATLLPNGRVLLVGGDPGTTGALASAELYDPASGIWTATGSLATARERHTATLLPNGKVLVTAGYTGTSHLNNAELYDPASGTWTATGSFATARAGHTATLLLNGQVLVAGGYNGNYLASAELYDPASGTWTATGSLATARSLHTATLLPNGKVLVAGGYNIALGALASAELYVGPMPTPTPTPTPAATPTLGDISTRLQVGTSDRVMIAGFIVQGSSPKRVLIRAAGPSLTQFGVPNALANPRLELHDTNNTIGMNDNWQTTQIGGVITSDQVAEIQNSGLAPSDPLESAVIATLAPGSYTAIVQGVNGGTGVGIVEAYDLGATSGSLLANISTRGFVLTGDSAMIGGFIVVTQPTRVIIRAIGPSLTQFGVPDALANPQLELHDATSLIGRNDDWQTTQIGGLITSDQVAAIQNSQLAPTNSAESAIIATLQPGSYTAIVRGVNNTTGNALVEVYALQ